MKKLRQITQWATQMGLRYIAFRLWFEFILRTGLLRIRFPTTAAFKTWVTLDYWRKNTPDFFFTSRAELSAGYLAAPNSELTSISQRIKNGWLQFFHGEWKEIALNDWLTNCSTGRSYSNQKHWTKVPDFNPEFGDIKYVWEKSRFSFAQPILRHDLITGEDSSEFLLKQMESWIDHNPLNQGPNFRCSQEISLRIFNWINILYFYRDSANLNEERFKKIIFSVYGQVKHIRNNIHFSRIAVRNNHAITETLALYTAGCLFPFFEEAAEWRTLGKKWLEEEINYQIYDDGSYLQFSFNYHRVAAQLLTWAFSLSKLHGDKFSDTVYEKAHRVVILLATCQDQISGQLPNYGANDGSLFFRWNDQPFRDFSPVLDALHYLLTGYDLYSKHYEDRLWLGVNKTHSKRFDCVKVTDGYFSFPRGGLFVYRKNTFLVFIVCTSYKNRPSQADNLHLDVWNNGTNVLIDGGSYRYNTEPYLSKYFFGTESHNTIMIENEDQMEKGSRFIWWNWTKVISTEWRETPHSIVFEGAIGAFQKLGNIEHRRTVTIDKLKSAVQVEDKVSGSGNRTIRQLWHFNPSAAPAIVSTGGKKLLKPAYYSPTYGVKEDIEQMEFISSGEKITTEIYV